jgi:(p)ppGpp synthase/HD superfamily hydrolase
MHQESEMGVAARFAYDRLKETPDYALGKYATVNPQNSWIRKLMSWKKDPKANSKIKIFENTILVLSPKKDIVELPIGATALDFAYKVHEEVGNHAAAAMRNGEPTNMGDALRFGDIIEITTYKHVQPKIEWLKLAKTHYAQSKIRSYLSHNATKKELENIREFKTRITLVTASRSGLLDAVRAVFARLLVPIETIEFATTRGILGRTQTIMITCAPIDNVQIKKLIPELLTVKGVTNAKAGRVKTQFGN